jgi:hypothetical protein
VTSSGAARPVRTAETGQRGRLVVAVLVLASFGPYVVSGLRTEQFAVYGLLATIGFVQLMSTRLPSLPPRAWTLLATWAVYVTIAAVVGVGEQPPSRWAPGALLAAVDNFVAPLAVLLLVWSTVAPGTADRALRLAAKLIALSMAFNGVLAVGMTRVDMSGLLRPFWSGAEGTATAERAALAGRFSGVFNQPAEAGIAYGIAALCAWYVWRERPRLLYPLLLAIVAGGLLSVSKVFIFGGLPVVLWLLLRGSRTRGTALFVGVAAILGVIQSGIAGQWTGADSLGRLLRPAEDQNLLTLFTAGRFGQDSTLSGAFDQVWQVSPWFGFGIRGLMTPSDNAWLGAFIAAGVIGLAAYTATLLTIFVIARREKTDAGRAFATGLVVVIIAGSMGLAALTANRVTTLIWLLIALVALGQSSRWSRPGGSDDGPGEVFPGRPIGVDGQVEGVVVDDSALPGGGGGRAQGGRVLRQE